MGLRCNRLLEQCHSIISGYFWDFSFASFWFAIMEDVSVWFYLLGGVKKRIEQGLKKVFFFNPYCKDLLLLIGGCFGTYTSIQVSYYFKSINLNTVCNFWPPGVPQSNQWDQGSGCLHCKQAPLLIKIYLSIDSGRNVLRQGHVFKFYSRYFYSWSPTSFLTLCLSPRSYRDRPPNETHRYLE